MSFSYSETNAIGDLDLLFRRYHRELSGLAYARLKDREAAADVVQDAFIRLMRRDQAEAATLAVESPRFLLRRIVSNLTIDIARRHRRRGREIGLEALAETLADPYPTVERQLVARQDYALLKQALDELPQAARAALLLNRIEGLTHAEVGLRLGISASMVSKHIMNALRHCLRRLGHLR